MSALWSRRGGHREGPLLLLLHGMGCTAEVFDGLTGEAEQRWPGPWLVPDLRGHGRSPWAPSYTYERHAADVAALVTGPDDVWVVGHSMGGVVGLALAADHLRGRVAGVVGLGIKVVWTDEEVARLAALAERAPQVFPTRAQAVDRYLRVSGLRGLVAPDDPAVGPGVAPVGSGWRLAMDPAAFAVGVPDLRGLLAGALGARVVLARGEHDPMVSDGDLAALPAEATSLGGLGHHPHVEDPSAVLDLVLSLRRGGTAEADR